MFISIISITICKACSKQHIISSEPGKITVDQITGYLAWYGFFIRLRKTIDKRTNDNFVDS